MAVEIFTNLGNTTVTSGGTTAPASGTTETWTVASSASFPAASNSAAPPTQFHVADVASNSEIIAVTNVSGATWSVTRGAESTTPVAHTAGFAIFQVVSAGGYAQLRAVDWLNVVTMFGADPTGVADSTAAIQAALSGLPSGGGTVYIPAGTYKITSSLAPAVSGTTIRGDNGAVTLLLAAATTVPIINVTSALSNVTITGIIFDGNAANQSAEGNSLVHFTSPTSLVIEDCTFQNSYDASSSHATPAIQLRMPQYSHIRGCYIYNCGYGIQLGSLNTDSTPMYGNSITDCDINTTGQDGIFLTENLGTVGSVTPSGYLRGTVVANCRFTQVGDASVEVGSGSVGTVVSGCTMDNTSNTAVGNNGIIVRDSQDITITGCTIRGYLKSSAAAIYLLNLNGTSGNGKQDQDIAISNCVIDTVDYGINDGAGVPGLTISGCVLNKFSQTSAGAAGIKLASTSTFTVTGILLANGSGTPGSNEALSMVSAHDGTVSGCNFFNNRGNDALIFNSASFNITVTACRFGPSNTGHALRVFDTGSHDITIAGNDLSGNNTGNGITLNASPAANISIRGNNAVNPYGAETVSVPSSATPVAIAQHDRTYYVTNGAAVNTFAVNPTVAVLSSALSTGGAITSLPVGALNAAVPSGTVLVSSGSNSQSWTTSGAALNATSITVTSQTPNFAYPAGSTITAGTGLTVTVPSSALVPIRVPAGSVLIPTYTSAPTWVVEGE